MGYKLGYHILVLPNQVLLINSVLTNKVLLYTIVGSMLIHSIHSLCTHIMYTAVQGSYNNSVICKWNITAISTCHSTAFLIIRKDLHESQSPSGQNCPIKDHVQLQYSGDQVDYYCGDSTANNCPISNCFPTLGITNSGECGNAQ